ncbi:type I restriction enzyme HsdR N-terminal domain-containing protein [Stenotrophomonas sp. CFBP 13725]|uniref:type I restriction enzyme HsdR N-terminal domain-containing protein n=1 Tax=Stenotrophomonas sp. CFBP 13725 TaxID=2775297 RepID=UPI0017859003|nr:type I restriction enzyme HsdR N-terminal domain-containing protein [Stenotrophomonas sp. CFBP 13725]MBD8635700.1 type I restriction enzyme HsdR N-terminal domain-containing protein [Stenotrophomonas sp. CFBP 13725]
MLKIPKKVLDRWPTTVKPLVAVAVSHKTKDVSEADTVTLVKDMLAEVFGYDKYNELTSEQQIRGTFCDLAVKIDGKIRVLIEVKAAAIALNETHLRQAINYGAHEGIEWIVLTNALEWRLYRIKFGQPIEYELVSSFCVADVNLKNEEDQRRLFLLCREGITSDAMGLYHQHISVLNKFTVAQVVLGEPVVAVVRRELRRLFPELKIESEAIVELLNNEILKREVLDGEKVKDAQLRIRKAQSKSAKDQASRQSVREAQAVPEA